MAHTPGPWRVWWGHAEDGGRVDGICAGEVGGETEHTIVETDCGFYPPTPDDARLIAAAPEMLSLLRELLQMAEATHRADDCRCGDIFTEAHAVLKKIEGGDAPSTRR